MRILLADDQKKVRFALRVLLQQQPGFEVVGEAVDSVDLLAQVGASPPDLVLVDWELPGQTGKQLLPALRNVCPGVAIVVLSPRLEARQTALNAGANAFICKCDSPERLLAAIAEVREGLAEMDVTSQPISPSGEAEH
jgi:DNA-binding NarL/FixJ family response regulator